MSLGKMTRVEDWRNEREVGWQGSWAQFTRRVPE
jgi:hypothetical protein